MKFLCSHCRAKYQIADEKVMGRTLRMTCRNCQQEIVIRGDETGQHSTTGQSGSGLIHLNQVSTVERGALRPSHLPAPPSALGADFQRNVAGSHPAHVPPPTPFDQWHVAVNDSPVGPHTREEVARMFAEGTVNAQSLAWREGLDDWLPIRSLPELAAYCMPVTARGSLPPPPPFTQPSQRNDMAPIGGRGGAAPAVTLEDWGSFIEPNPTHSQIAVNPLLTAGAAAERRGPMPSWPAMFALAGGFAFLMTGLAIIGARWLQSDRPQAATAAATAVGAQAPAAAAPQPVARVGASADAEGNAMVIELDDPGLQTERRAATRARTAAAPGQPTKANGKGLSAAQRDMLARMGGDTGSDIAGLNTPKTAIGGGAAHQSGGLTAAQLSQVVANGRKNLQRCYESALRGSNSTDTVRMDVQVSVSPSGNVTSVSAGGTGLPGMKECIEKTVRMWRFPNAGDSTQTKFPVLFQPGG